MSGRREEMNGGGDERKKGGEEMVIDHFRQLRIYQLGFKSAMTIFELSKGWPPHERYSLTDQIRRSSRSVCANVAEAWAKRRYTAHFISKLTDADGEAAETQTWLDFAHTAGYINETEFRELSEQYRMISGGLVKMMTDPAKWCGPALLLREDTASYDA